jgi:hypothetical protein
MTSFIEDLVRDEGWSKSDSGRIRKNVFFNPSYSIRRRLFEEPTVVTVVIHGLVVLYFDREVTGSNNLKQELNSVLVDHGMRANLNWRADFKCNAIVFITRAISESEIRILCAKCMFWYQCSPLSRAEMNLNTAYKPLIGLVPESTILMDRIQIPWLPLELWVEILAQVAPLFGGFRTIDYGIIKYPLFFQSPREQLVVQWLCMRLSKQHGASSSTIYELVLAKNEEFKVSERMKLICGRLRSRVERTPTLFGAVHFKGRRYNVTIDSGIIKHCENNNCKLCMLNYAALYLACQMFGGRAYHDEYLDEFFWPYCDYYNRDVIHITKDTSSMLLWCLDRSCEIDFSGTACLLDADFNKKRVEGEIMSRFGDHVWSKIWSCQLRNIAGGTRDPVSWKVMK